MLTLVKFIKLRRLVFFFAFCVHVLNASVTLWWNAQLSGIIDNVSSGTALPGGMIASALLTVPAMCAANFIKDYVTGYISESITHDLRMAYARHFLFLPVAEVDDLNEGELLSKLHNEIIGISGYINGNLFQLLDMAVRFLFSFAWLFYWNPKLAVLPNLPAIAILAYIFWSSKVIGDAAARGAQAKTEMNRYADILLTLFPVIRLYEAAQLTLRGYRGAVRTWESQTTRLERTKARLMSLSGLLSNIPLLLLFLTGGTMAIGGALSVGTLYVFLNLSGNVSGVLMNMPGVITAFRQFTANMNRLSPYLDLPGREGIA